MSQKFAIVKILDEESYPLREFFDRYISHRIAAGSVAGTISNIRRLTARFLDFIGPVNVSDVTPERADLYRLRMVNRYSSNYSRLNVCTIKAAFEYASSLGIIQINPFKNIDLPRITFAGRILSESDLKLFIGSLTGDFQRAAKLALYTGMRRNEIVRLEWCDISEESILIPRQKSKSKRERTIYLSAAARGILGRRGVGLVFSLTTHSLNEAITASWRRLGIGRVRFHDLRHMAAARHYDANLDEQSLMACFGWSNPSSVAPYRHRSVRREKKAMDKMAYSL